VGLNWLLNRWHAGQNAILADEMGLGKTAQTVSFLEHLYRVNHVRGPFLIVCPLSTMEHWRREFEVWTAMTVCVYHDRPEGRAIIRDMEWFCEGAGSTALKFSVRAGVERGVHSYSGMLDICARREVVVAGAHVFFACGPLSRSW
jgi:chromodomain-helicase-DNA-binding protein 7